MMWYIYIYVQKQNTCTRKLRSSKTHTAPHTHTLSLIIFNMNSNTADQLFPGDTIQPCRQHVCLCHSETTRQRNVLNQHGENRSQMVKDGWNQYTGLPSPCIHHHSSHLDTFGTNIWHFFGKGELFFAFSRDWLYNIDQGSGDDQPRVSWLQIPDLVRTSPFLSRQWIITLNGPWVSNLQQIERWYHVFTAFRY